MKASYRWLRALLPGLPDSPREIADRLSNAGIAVDGISEFGAGTEAIVVAEVLAIEPHPSRSKLKLVTVDRGGGQKQKVVCGAPNVPSPGGLVAFAPLGTVLPAVGMTLTPREIGGVVSEGMLCSEVELGLAARAAGAQGHEGDPGILILSGVDAKPGTPLRDALCGVHDFVYELDLTPNRPDALGHVGLARELGALFKLKFKPPQADAPQRAAPGQVHDLVKVEIEDTARCPHYGAAMVVDVTIGPSPAWLRYRLESLGVRSISNVVDITNLVMLEWGHPMHAFDFERVRGGKIVVRRATSGEKLETLDGVERSLSSDDLVICDGEGPVALAGVMGGAGSEIGPKTRRVLLECAYFTTRGIRRSSRRHALHTESSHRFERGVDAGDIPDVLAQAASLMTQLAGGAGVPGVILAGVELAHPKPIALRERRLNVLLGVDVPFGEATDVLAALGFAASAGRDDAAGGRAIEVTPPTHRPDIQGEADLIEEVMRVRGIAAIPTVLPAIKPQPPRTTGATEARVRRVAIELGLSEALAFSFIAPRQIAALGLPPAPITLQNPLGEERSVMRTTLLPGLFDAAIRARRHGVADARLFQIGARFLAPDPNVAAGAQVERALGLKSAPLPYEARSFAAVMTGKRDAVLQKPDDVDVYDAKGIACTIVERVTRRAATVRHQPPERRAPYLHPRAAGEVLVEGKIAGVFGVLHPDVADLFGVEGSLALVELDLETLDEVGLALPKYKPIPTLPATTRDIALVVSDDVTAGSVAIEIKKAAGDLCESVELFDLFRGGSIPEDNRSLAFHVIYRDPLAATDPEKARTLTDDEVDKRHASVVGAVQQRFGAQLRS